MPVCPARSIFSLGCLIRDDPVSPGSGPAHKLRFSAGRLPIGRRRGWRAGGSARSPDPPCRSASRRRSTTPRGWRGDVGPVLRRATVVPTSRLRSTRAAIGATASASWSAASVKPRMASQRGRLAAASFGHLMQVVQHGLKKIQYWRGLIDGCLTGTRLSLDQIEHRTANAYQRSGLGTAGRTSKELRTWVLGDRPIRGTAPWRHPGMGQCIARGTGPRLGRSHDRRAPPAGAVASARAR